jgi:hypothetical protein
MKLWKRFAIAAFVAFLYYFCQIGANLHVRCRYNSQWVMEDWLAILLGIALFSGLAVAMDAFVRCSKSPLLRRLFNHLFLVVLAGGILNIILGYVIGMTNLNLLLWMLAMLLIGYSFASPHKHLDLYAAKICMVFSPSILLALIPMLFLSTWPNRTGALPPPSRSAANKTPVFIFVFDEWSFLRSSRNGEFEESLQNIRKLAQQSVIFTKVKSFSVDTQESLPSFLFQTDKVFTITENETVFKDGDKLIPTKQIPSIFQLAHQQNYRTSLLGFYHPYRQMLGDAVDYCNIYPSSTCSKYPGGGFGDIFLWRLASICRTCGDPIILQSKINNRIDSRLWFDMRAAYRKEMLDILANSSKDSFAFFHAPWPHYPYVCNPDGTYFGFRWDMWRLEDYLRELRYLDKLIGEIVETLRADNNFDDALLIMTADHGWRQDSDQEILQIPDFKKRVSLIVKLPGEKTGHVIDKEFCTNQFQPLFDAVFAGEKDPQVLLKILESIGAAKN